MYLYHLSVVCFRLINWPECFKETVNGISYNFSQEDGICCCFHTEEKGHKHFSLFCLCVNLQHIARICSHAYLRLNCLKVQDFCLVKLQCLVLCSNTTDTNEWVVIRLQLSLMTSWSLESSMLEQGNDENKQCRGVTGAGLENTQYVYMMLEKLLC